LQKPQTPPRSLGICPIATAIVGSFCCGQLAVQFMQISFLFYIFVLSIVYIFLLPFIYKRPLLNNQTTGQAFIIQSPAGDTFDGTFPGNLS